MEVWMTGVGRSVVRIGETAVSGGGFEVFVANALSSYCRLSMYD